MRRLTKSAVCAAVLVLAYGCGDGGGQGPEAEFATAPASESGDGQHGMAGRELPQPLRVLVTRDGDPAVGAVVTWTTEDGTIAGNGATDPLGLATAEWTLPRVASSELRARARLQGQELPGVDFHASASFPSLELLDGNEQQGTVGTDLPEPLRVRVTWQGAPVKDEPVRWSPNVEPLSEWTDADGIAAATWRLGTSAGPVLARARLDGRDSPEVSFFATALCATGDQCVSVGPLAYVGGEGNVVVTHFDGSEPVVLAEAASQPAWSPDGSQIAFTRPIAGLLQKWQLCVARADGSDPGCVVGDEDGTIQGRPSWSPDGSKVAFTISCPDGQCGQFGGSLSSLRVLNVATMRVVTVDTPPLSSVSWSPDGRKIAFTGVSGRPLGQGALGVVNPDGSELEILATSMGSYLVSEVAWSPDGGRLALGLFACSEWDCDTAIGIAEADATQLRVLVRGLDNGGFVSSPAWSPDGARIAYTLDEPSGDGFMSEILVIGADGGTGEVLVSGGRLPSWRP